AGVSESACVVGLFTRPGPATGLPTWTEQSDLRFAMHCAQGEFPRVILAPGDHEEAFELTWQAFNLADELQTPVMILGDSYLSDNRQTVPPFDGSAVTIHRGKLVAEGDIADRADALDDDGGYLRYKLTDDGISVRALPGVTGAIQIVNSYEHDERGYGAQGEIASVRKAQNEKRLHKLDHARDIVPPPTHYAAEGPELSLLVFGTTKMPALQAMDWLDDEGIAVEMLQLTTLWPFPVDEVADYLDGAKRTLVIEANATGQLEGLVRQYALREVDDRLHRYDGRPFSPEMIYAKALETLGRKSDVAPSGQRLEGVAL
ncbi:MAG: 2-oxoacid:acceptor oxidoreductase subunit alpha, partial [Coriobacteriales bacterium]|nr:2-oxoacid:acceptor oxidoreductase subunit alpha [Coriobacteriales bacterium]